MSWLHLAFWKVCSTHWFVHGTIPSVFYRYSTFMILQMLDSSRYARKNTSRCLIVIKKFVIEFITIWHTLLGYYLVKGNHTFVCFLSTFLITFFFSSCTEVKVVVVFDAEMSGLPTHKETFVGYDIFPLL